MTTLLIKILGWLSGSTKVVFQFLLPILEDNSAKLLAALLPIALDVVTSLADSSKTGEQKRAAAVDAIKAQAIQTGINATTSAVNLAVELVVQKLNPPAAPAPATTPAK